MSQSHITSAGYSSKPLGTDYLHFFQDSAYNRDRELYDTLLTEALNIYGTPMMYYVITYDTSYNQLFGSDDNRTILRKFPVKVYYQLPKELEQFDVYGIEGLDNFRAHISKRHFEYASQQGLSATLYPVTSGAETSAYDTRRPKVGDVVKAEYNNIFYEIIDVGEEEEMFLQGKHTWTLTLRTLKNESYNVSASTSADMDEIISEIVDKEDIFQDNSYISSADDDVLYSSGGSEESSEQDPLGGW